MSFKYFPTYLELQKYWKPLLLVFVGYFILTIIVCYWTNFNNSSLEKRTGIIEDIKINVVPGKTSMWYIINIRIKGDPICYVQEWQVKNNILLYYFLFNEKKFTKNIYFEPGHRVEFYVNNTPKPYSYILTEKIHDNSLIECYKSVETHEDIKAIVSYGLKIDNNMIFDYTKRDFVTSLFERMSLGLIIILFPLTFIGITYLNNIFDFLKNK